MDYIPNVKKSDLKRIIKRDFSPNFFETVETELGKYSDNEAIRVKLAILKLSKGKIKQVRYFTSIAISDYRDVLFWAEYPSFVEIGFDTEHMKKSEVKRLREKDWVEYNEWLKKQRMV